MAKQVTETIARPARTAGQGGLAWAILVLIDSFVHLTTAQYGALLLLLTLIVGAIQVAVENRTGKGVLRAVPPRTAPALDDKGHYGANAVIWVFAIIGIVLLLLLLVGVLHAK